MATGGMDLSSLKKALDEPDEVKDTSSKSQASESELKLELFLWNIHGETRSGMAETRQILVKKVLGKCNPHVLLLQEVKTKKCLPRGGKYQYHHSATSSEASIGYDDWLFDTPRKINIPEIIGKERLLSDEGAPSTRATERTPDQMFYNDHSCAIRLRHRSTGKELILMSFHNVSPRTGGEKANIILYAKGFIKLVCLVHNHEKVPVVAGVDFNCDRSDLEVHAIELGCILPDYDSSVRRRHKKKIDLYVLKGSSSVYSRVEVRVFEALPLTDPTSAEADTHPLGREYIRYLVDNAPVNKKTNTKLTMEDYTRTANHDPTLCKVTLTY